MKKKKRVAEIVAEENRKTIQVSIICNTYNHERYIRDALEGFVKQVTTFPLEVLIHDDASTDHTAEIIQEYEMKYPEIIKPIYQKENQYLKYVPISKEYQYPRAQGKYVAFCEGDDYWTDCYKLQKQYEALESHPEIDICAHASTTISAADGKILRQSIRLKQDGIIPTETVIEGGGGFVASASLFFRKSILVDLPPFRKMNGLDYFLQIHGALRGGMYYLCDNMSVYRSDVPNSTTQRIRRKIKYKIDNGNYVYKTLKQLDKDTQKKYHKTIWKCIIRNRIRQIAYHLIAIRQFHR